MARASATLIASARAELKKLWKATLAGDPGSAANEIPDDVLAAIKRSINSATKTYRYVLPTQLVAQVANPLLDAHSIQATCGLDEAFDARSVCDEVIVSFDRANHDVLGGSPEPYANNPLRIPAFTADRITAQRDKRGFSDLLLVLDYSGGTGVARLLLRAVLREIHDRLATVRIVYPVPNRIAEGRAKDLLDRFLASRTGGIRLQSVAVALFRTVGIRFRLFQSVESHHINAADASTGSAADLECKAADGSVAIAVEVKDRALTIRQAQDKLPAMREKGIRELIFLVQGTSSTGESIALANLIDQEFASGQNVHICSFGEFLKTCLVLFGEAGRREFFRAVGEELDERKADLSHRQGWRDLLSSI